MSKGGVQSTPRRLFELDALRGIAALAVVLFHYTVVVYRFVPDAESASFQFKHGHYGVELFFIISGFVIFMTINGCKSGMDFIVSRVARIYPVFWAAVFLTYGVSLIFPLNAQSYDLVQLVVNITMLQDYAKIPAIDDVYWSLSYELGFYFCIWCLFMVKGLKYIEPLSGIWLVGGTVFYFFPEIIPHPLHYLMLVNSYTHLFIAGIMFYRCWQYGFTLSRLLFLLAVIYIQYLQEGFLGAAIIFVFIVTFVLIIKGYALVLKNKALVYLGGISYSLYLIHHMIGFRIIQELQSQGVEANMALLLTLVFILLLASTMTYLIEKPALRSIKRTWKKYEQRNGS